MASDVLCNFFNCKVEVIRLRNIDCEFQYELKVTVDKVTWRVLRMYTEFLCLDHCLIVKYGMTNMDSLPKIPRDCNYPLFFQMRMEAVDIYIKKVFCLFLQDLPKELVDFLDLQKYDIWYMLRRLYNAIYALNWVDSPPRDHALSIMEVHSITERRKGNCSPFPIAEELQQEFCAILEFCSELKKLQINGFIEMMYRDSNIERESVKFDLKSFKRLTYLILARLDVSTFILADLQRKSLVNLDVYDCFVTKLTDILLCDHKPLTCTDSDESKIWTGLRKLDVQKNEINDLECGLSLIPNIEFLDASYNKLRSVNLSNYQCLKNLKTLNLSRNSIRVIGESFGQMPHIESLDLSFNSLTVIKPLRNLVRLKSLNLEYNGIFDLHEISYLNHLESLKELELTGNPISKLPDYRVNVFYKLENLVDKVLLDCESPSQGELELLSILNSINTLII